MGVLRGRGDTAGARPRAPLSARQAKEAFHHRRATALVAARLPDRAARTAAADDDRRRRTVSHSRTSGVDVFLLTTDTDKCPRSPLACSSTAQIHRVKVAGVSVM